MRLTFSLHAIGPKYTQGFYRSANIQLFLPVGGRPPLCYYKAAYDGGGYVPLGKGFILKGDIHFAYGANIRSGQVTLLSSPLLRVSLKLWECLARVDEWFGPVHGDARGTWFEPGAIYSPHTSSTPPSIHIPSTATLEF